VRTPGEEGQPSERRQGGQPCHLANPDGSGITRRL
jgi:hypothetical protein